MSDHVVRAKVAVRTAAPLAHLLLHCDPEDAPALAARLAVQLPLVMLCGTRSGAWSALHLAPDEWLLIGPEEDAARLSAAIDRACADWPLSLVDISDRALCYDIYGPEAETLLSAGCPVDIALASFVPGSCTRTLFGKAMVMLWRTGPDEFRLEVARSFAPYALELLSVAALELS